MPRLLVLDKCAFQQVPEQILVDFAKNYNVVLPYVLSVECLMSDDLNGSRPSKDRDISNDLFDIKYVAYLCLADGILTRDKKLFIPLAEAGFSDRDVFFDLDEVQDEYLCRWN